MGATYMTITLSKEPWKARRKRRAWRTISRMSLLCLAAMFFARLVLLMIDLIQLQIETVGAVTVPACAVVFIVTGWKLREWWEEYKLFRKEKRRCRTKRIIFGSAPSVVPTSTPAKPVTAGRKETVG